MALPIDLKGKVAFVSGMADPNGYGWAITKALAEAVRVSGSMATLYLNYNQIGDEGAKAIAEAVRSSGSLALKKLVVPVAIKKHAQLVAACKSKGVELV